jgi:hypothetical protein
VLQVSEIDVPLLQCTAIFCVLTTEYFASIIINDLLRELHQDRLMRSLAAEAAPPAGPKTKRSRADTRVDAASSSKRQRNKSSCKQADEKASPAYEVVDPCDDGHSAAPQNPDYDWDFLLAQQLQAEFDAEGSPQAATAMTAAAPQRANALSTVQNALVQNSLRIRIK